MQIGSRIRQLRRRLGMTQEKLAQQLGVVPQVVSKWERDCGLPDITLLLSLAAALDTSVDALLGAAPDQRERRYQEVTQELEAVYLSGRPGESDLPGAIAFLRQALRELPQEDRLLRRLAQLLLQLGQSPEGSFEDMRSCLRILERLAVGRQDPGETAGLLAELYLAYLAAGEAARAKELLVRFPARQLCREELRFYQLGEAERAQYENDELRYLLLRLHQLCCMANGAPASATPPALKSDQEGLAWLRFAYQVYALVNDFRPFPDLMSIFLELDLSLVEQALLAGDTACALAQMELTAGRLPDETRKDYADGLLLRCADARSPFAVLPREPRFLALISGLLSGLPISGAPMYLETQASADPV